MCTVSQLAAFLLCPRGRLFFFLFLPSQAIFTVSQLAAFLLCPTGRLFFFFFCRHRQSSQSPSWQLSFSAPQAGYILFFSFLLCPQAGYSFFSFFCHHKQFFHSLTGHFLSLPPQANHSSQPHRQFHSSAQILSSSVATTKNLSQLRKPPLNKSCSLFLYTTGKASVLGSQSALKTNLNRNQYMRIQFHKTLQIGLSTTTTRRLHIHK